LPFARQFGDGADLFPKTIIISIKIIHTIGPDKTLIFCGNVPYLNFINKLIGINSPNSNMPPIVVLHFNLETTHVYFIIKFLAFKGKLIDK
jgi:hypothetical protein